MNVPGQSSATGDTADTMLRSVAIPLIVLAALWTGIIAAVNPTGDFMVNDDWSFTRALEQFTSEGRITTTGWGPPGAPGGPALAVHVLWGRLFTLFGGVNATTLRLSVLCMGIIGSMALLMLLRVSGASPGLALWGTLTLVFNPLFLSQSFTFMTDISFMAMAAFSLLFIAVGVKRDTLILVAIGLVFALAAILTRQIGVVIPAGFILALALTPSEKRPSLSRSMLLVIILVMVPWVAYELLLSWIGGTPITDHQVVRNIFGYVNAKDTSSYLQMLGEHLGVALLYVGFLLSPVLGLRYPDRLQKRGFRYFFVILTGLFFAGETALAVGFLDVPVRFFRNVIFDFGIGPVLLKDTYILGIPRGWRLPPSVYLFLVYWSLLAAGLLCVMILEGLRGLVKNRDLPDGDQQSFPGVFSLCSGILYIGIILVTGYHDRYFIPVCMFFLVWLLGYGPDRVTRPVSIVGALPAAAMLVAMAVFSVGAVRDFMEFKRSLGCAQEYALRELVEDPCRMDGGFEFNGYHCYRQDFEARPGLSWWWVDREDCVLTLGPLPGYQVVREFRFRRILGPDGAVHVLVQTR